MGNLGVFSFKVLTYFPLILLKNVQDWSQTWVSYNIDSFSAEADDDF